ncbi:MAG: type I 3-dehydroquinate dehydratase [Lachnospiraceae bacterium]|nr:type I 3-dehydroquinate dehydratase [Lachnospiraceae bacterium]
MDNRKLGQGMPKICIPIVEQTQADIVAAAGELRHSVADLVEWRADYYEDLRCQDQLQETVCQLGQALGEKELLFTIRTQDEGGEQQITFADYASILVAVAELPEIQYVDVEMFSGMRRQSQEDWEQAENYSQMWEQAENHSQVWEYEDHEAYVPVKGLLRQLHHKVTIIGSYHDFEKTPSVEEITKRLVLMRRLGADIPKMAVMPQKQEDVLALMTAGWEAKKLLDPVPVITMSMGGMGLISRVAGESFGSAVTFGCVGKPSAPGQIEAEQLQQVLKILHENS